MFGTEGSGDYFNENGELRAFIIIFKLMMMFKIGDKLIFIILPFSYKVTR